MNNQPMTPSNNPPAPVAAPAPQPDDQQQGSPMDGCISTVDQFISDPKSITPQNLNQLKMDLEDLKTVFDQEDSGQENNAPTPPAAQGGLAAMIGGK